MTIARWINARVMAGKETLIALMAPTEARVDEVCFRALIEYAEPWQRPERFSRKGVVGLRWPNGVEAIGFTPEREGRPRGGNYSLTWCTEIVDWKAGTRLDAFRNLDTATRVGEARIVWDSTAKGRNDVRTLLEDWHALDPELHVNMPGAMFDNPLLDTSYLRSQWLSYSGVRRDEELFGASHRESAGALWTQAVLDATRVTDLPANGLEWVCVAVDPATSTHESSDETGIVVGGRGRDGHAYITDDLSGTYPPATSADGGAVGWGDIAVDAADPRKPGPRRGRIVIERKHLGDNAAFVLRSRAEVRGLRTRVLARDEPWPAFDRETIFIREQNTNLSKGTRAEGPAAETDAGVVHLVDPDPESPRFSDLERECVTYVPGVTKRSPNRLDAFAYVVIELRELRLDAPPNRERDAATAAAANAELQRRLRGAAAPGRTLAGRGLAVAGSGRRLGL